MHPNLFLLIPKRVRRQRTVAQGLQNPRRVSDIRGALTVQVIVEYLQLWNLVDNLVLHQGTPYQHTWRLSKHGVYSSKSAYDAFFIGTVKFGPWKRIWKTWAPLKCKFFIWLAVKNRCWTADRLAKRGLAHPAACPLCDQAEETIQHCLVSCVFSREVWFLLFAKLRLSTLSPQSSDKFLNWWSRAVKTVPKKLRKGLNTHHVGCLGNLEASEDCVFEGQRPCVHTVLQVVANECTLWCAAGASALQELLTRQPTLRV
jgi:hypothetical protein